MKPNLPKNPFKDLKLDAYEQEIEDAINRGKYELEDLTPERKKQLQQSAAYTLKLLEQEKKQNLKKKNVNFRISAADLNQLKRKALDEGVAYQSIITNLIRRYNTGKIKFLS